MSRECSNHSSTFCYVCGSFKRNLSDAQSHQIFRNCISYT